MKTESQKTVLLVGGKGGVGKTTCSSAIATRFAATGEKTLLITSDLSPSLSDIFERAIGDKITTVTDNLDAFEISQDAIAAWWKKRFGPDFKGILENLIDVEALDRESQHQLLDYIGSAPSLREETMLDIITDIGENRGYDRIVWDTAPAGETLNLLTMPATIKKHLTAGAKVFEGLDKIGKQLLGKRPIASIMDDWIGVSERISNFIRTSSEFIIVANPEALVVSQVRRMIDALGEYDVPVRGFVINCVIERADSVSLVAMEKTQRPYVEELEKMAGDKAVALLPLSFTEIRGMDRLREIGELLVTTLAL